MAVVAAKPGYIASPAIAPLTYTAPIYQTAYAPLKYAPLSYAYSAQYSAPAYYKAALTTPYIYGGLPLAYHGAYLH